MESSGTVDPVFVAGLQHVLIRILKGSRYTTAVANEATSPESRTLV